MGSDFLNRVLFILVYGNPSSLLNIPCADADTEKRMLWTLKKTMETSMLLILVAPHIYTFLHCSYFIFFRKTGTLTVNVKPSEMFFLILIFAERRRLIYGDIRYSLFLYSLLLCWMTSSRTQKSVVEVHLAQNRKKCARRDCPALQQSVNIVAKTVCLQQLCLIQLVWVDTQRSIHILFSFLFRNNSTESMVRGPYLGPSFF